jgi:hypothetical protein
LLWRSQLPKEGWAGFIEAIALDRDWLGDKREVILRYGKETRQRSDAIDPFWSYSHSADQEFRQSGHPFGWRPNADDWLRNQAWFLCDEDDDTTALALEPFARDFDGVVGSLHSYWPDQGRTVSTVSALITLWLASGSDCPADTLTGAYDTCLEIAMRALFDPSLAEIPRRFRLLVLRQLAADQTRLPKSWLDSVATRIREAANRATDKSTEPTELLELANRMLPQLMAANPESATAA